MPSERARDGKNPVHRRRRRGLPTTEALKRSGELGASAASHGGGRMQREGGGLEHSTIRHVQTPTRSLPASSGSSPPASERSVCGGGKCGSGANQRQARPCNKTLAMNAATSSASMEPHRRQVNNQAAQACFQPSPCRLARRFAQNNERTMSDGSCRRVVGRRWAPVAAATFGTM